MKSQLIIRYAHYGKTRCNRLNTNAPWCCSQESRSSISALVPAPRGRLCRSVGGPRGAGGQREAREAPATLAALQRVICVHKSICLSVYGLCIYVSIGLSFSLSSYVSRVYVSMYPCCCVSMYVCHLCTYVTI